MRRESPEDKAGPGLGAGGSVLAEDDRVFLEGMARWLGERRLATPALLFLESTKPLNFVGSQLMFFFEPVVRALVNGGNYSRFASLMEDRDHVEEFLRMIERSDEEMRTRDKEVKR